MWLNKTRSVIVNAMDVGIISILRIFYIANIFFLPILVNKVQYLKNFVVLGEPIVNNKIVKFPLSLAYIKLYKIMYILIFIGIGKC